ncbi:septum formation initiator [Campylobacter sp. RM12327]|uniref:hypothetical protein n=1 Tax=Campylobacter sputorum TaxID=206 RepID=UPI000B776D6F|nr:MULTISPECIES: hypothetical protein [Campylobacter]ASM39506.1 hypothetical protein CSPB_0244 [Campylobacter sputorum]MBE7358412.1 septum formation initiator [Campylobacter sp. RM11302]MBF6670170.1 septum formation initiator [Campylobacter sp. RM12327]MBF6675317.1 septum formation initiator [Campylobacter sp. RM13538]MBF6676955.1 septum formation initiator [Campylobacter sp. RM12321]
MSEILDNYNPKESVVVHFVRKLFKYILVIVIVVGLGVYVGNMFFGKRSLETLIFIQNKQESLKKELEYLKQENAVLQKEYFELIGLEPNH